MRRRSLLLGGLAGAAGLTWLARPSDRGANHAPFFRQLSTALDQAGRAGPTLVVDRQLMRENIHTLQGHVQGRFDYRIVAKPLGQENQRLEVVDARSSDSNLARPPADHSPPPEDAMLRNEVEK